MARWASENAFDAQVSMAARNFVVPPELIKAIIAQESRFNPRAERVEAAISDKSVGLMQILYSTAKGEGYSGPIGTAAALDGLYEPLTNITYGTSYLQSMLQYTGGNVAAAISAYNGGWRPDIGFGAVATRPMVICLRRDSQGRCVETKNVGVGQYSNQDYVNKVLQNYDYFRSMMTPPQPPVAPVGKTTSIPLGDANQHESQPEVDWRDRRAHRRPLWFEVWETVTAICKLLLRKVFSRGPRS